MVPDRVEYLIRLMKLLIFREEFAIFFIINVRKIIKKCRISLHKKEDEIVPISG